MDAIFRLVLLILCYTFSLFAQDFQGLATYKTQRKLDLKIDSTQVGGGEMQKQLMAMLKKQFQKTYILTFDKNTSIYKEDEAPLLVFFTRTLTPGRRCCDIYIYFI